MPTFWLRSWIAYSLESPCSHLLIVSCQLQVERRAKSYTVSTFYIPQRQGR